MAPGVGTFERSDQCTDCPARKESAFEPGELDRPDQRSWGGEPHKGGTGLANPRDASGEKPAVGGMFEKPADGGAGQNRPPRLPPDEPGSAHLLSPPSGGKGSGRQKIEPRAAGSVAIAGMLLSEGEEIQFLGFSARAFR